MSSNNAQRDGLLLAASAAVSLVLMNSSLTSSFSQLLHTHISLGLAPLALDKSLLHWINDALMVLFFLLVGIEIKHEWLYGSLSSPAARVLPFSAAIGGILVPASIYCLFTMPSSMSMQGWAIPSATDIAFALGLMALFAPRTAPALLAFLIAVAVIDDLGAIVIIALFYASELHQLSLLLAAAAMAALFALSRMRVTGAWPYLALGVLLWLAVLKSGVHATLAGVILGLMLPSSAGANIAARIKPIVSFVVLPLFGLANAGVAIAHLSWASLWQPPQGAVIAGVTLGLCLGKPIGIMLGAWLGSRLAGSLPQGMRLSQFLPVACFCGVGFTMSLFIGSLAFDELASLADAAKIGVLSGTLISLILGTLLARKY